MGILARGIAPEVFLKEHLLYVHTKAEAGEYADAMAALRETRASVTDNVYLGALEKQLRQLIDLSEHRTLTDDQRSEILEPVSGIIEKALGSIHQPLPVQPAAPSIGPARLAPTLETDEREKALDHLKVQYFEQASRHLTAGEYDLALSEIRRVFVIDPENSTAKQYESVISELMNLKPPAPGEEEPEETPEQSVYEYERGMEQVSIINDRLHPVEPTPPAEEDVHPAFETSSEEGPDTQTHDTDEDASEEDVEPFHGPANKNVLPDRPALPLPLLPAKNEPLHVFTPSRTSVQPERQRAFPVRLVLALSGALVLLGIGVTFTLIRSSNADSAQPHLQLPVQTKAEIAGTTAAGTQIPESKIAPTGSSTTLSVPTQPVKTSGAVSQPQLDPPIQPPRKESVTREVAIQPVTSEEVPLQAPVSTSPAKEPQASASSESAPLNVAEPEPEPFIAVEKEPQIAHLVQPQIPAIAWETSNEASIVVRVLINEEGKPVKTRVLKSSNAVVETAVIAAVMQSTFTPGIMGKSAVTSWLTVPLKFKRGS